MATTGSAPSGSAPRVEHLGQGPDGKHRLRIDGVETTGDPRNSPFATAPDGRTIRVFNDEGNYIGAQDWNNISTETTPMASLGSTTGAALQKLGTSAGASDLLATADLDDSAEDLNRNRSVDG